MRHNMEKQLQGRCKNFISMYRYTTERWAQIPAEAANIPAGCGCLATPDLTTGLDSTDHKFTINWHSEWVSE